LTTPGAGMKAINRQISRSHEDPNFQLLWWRLCLAVGLTGATLFVHLTDPLRLSGPGVVASLGVLYTTLAGSWAAALAGAPSRPLLAIQLAADSVCIGLVVQFTGGPYSAFPLLFCLPIVLGAYHLGHRWSLILAGLAAILTGGGHFGLALGWLLTGAVGQLEYLQGWPVVVTATHVGAFLVVGIISGNLAGQLATRRGIMARNQLLIRKSQVEMRNILDNIQSGLLTVDAKGVITRVNPSCCRILEIPEAAMMKRHLTRVTSGGLEELADIILPVANGSDPVSRGEINVSRDGRIKPLGLNVNPVLTPKGTVIGAIAIFTDLTKEKDMAARIRESDRLAAIGELAAGIAHEIRNPLASIRGSIEILADDLQLEGYQGQLLDLVLKESGRVNTIINDFLGYSRMRAATLRQFSGVEFRDEIDLLVRQHIAAKDGHILLHTLLGPEDIQLVADPGQLTQLTLNLAINACEAMGYRGELFITIRETDGGETFELQVRDTGPGIDPDISKDLFSPFKTTKDTGTGLGLSIVARIAAAHGGQVVAESVPAGGAEFRVRWPRQEAEPYLNEDEAQGEREARLARVEDLLNQEA